ncbi:MAG TPA: RagB/SusD family nutrient uptake outer membrane protein, partial [Panacibacter sp.]|nr:RagB/SusD family nutrient uptake outer membrane protein [Panacibacter sp.]
MKFKIPIIISLTLLGMSSCTKLETKLQSSIVFNPGGGSGDPASLLNGCYNDMNGFWHGVSGMRAFEDLTGDALLVPTRGGDWDDNGDWRKFHAHGWTPTHAYLTGAFNGLGQMESDALSTLAFNPSPIQSDEALFLRSVAQFYYLDFFGQVPYREVDKYNAIDPAPVYQPQEAIDNIVTTLNGIITRNALPASNAPYRASIDAAKFLLMKVLLNKGAFLNREAPTFDNADLAQVIALGNDLINSNKYHLTVNYFDNFSVDNATKSGERIWAWPNNGSATNNGINAGGTNNYWMNTLHYNSWDKPGVYGGAGWNGFATVADFYNTFEGHGDGTPDSKIDTTKDQRLGGRFFPGVTDISGLRPGLLVGQQYNEAGVAETDRQGHPLKFTPEVHLVETDPATLEITGIRVIKYPPDYNNYNGGNQRNQLQIFRYADVILMVAEAKMRSGDNAGGLALVNELRTARGASTLTSLPLVNSTNVYDPNTLLAERGREMYSEGWRRQDLIRFGVYL